MKILFASLLTLLVLVAVTGLFLFIKWIGETSSNNVRLVSIAICILGVSLMWFMFFYGVL